MNESTARGSLRIIATIVTTLLCGCGGGGSGGSVTTGASGGNNSSSSAVPLQFDASNQGQVAEFAMGFGVTPLGLVQSAADWATAIGQSGGTTLQLSCSGGGSVALSLTQGAAANPTASGSQLSATLNACYIKPLGDGYSGTILIDYQTPASGYQQSAILTLQNVLTDVTTSGFTMSGGLAFDASASTTDKVLHVYSGSNSLNIMFNDAGKSSTDTLTAVDSIRRISLQTARTTTSISYSDQSGVLQGSFSVATQVPLASWFDAYPDAGTLTILGAANNSETVLADNGDNSSFSVYVGTTQAGTLSFVGLCDYLFSGTGWLNQDSNGQAYALVGESTQSLTLYQSPSLNSITPIQGPLTWYFSRTLAGMTNATTYFNLVGSNQTTPWVAAQVGATIAIQDATLTITPTAQFNPGSSYQLFGSNSLYTTFNAMGGGQYTFQPQTIAVANDISASIAVNATAILLGPTATLQLDSSASSAAGSPVSSTQWSQISGPTVNFSSTSSAITTISPASNGIGNAVIQVAVTNQSGDVAYQQVTIDVIGDTSSAIVIGYANSPGGIDAVVANYMGGGTSYATSSNAGNIIDVAINTSTARILAEVDTGNAFTSNTTLSYPDGAGSNLVWIPPNGTSCMSTATGQMTILNASYTGAGALQSLAMDFTVNCNGAMTYGAVRFNSAIPLSQ
jgi:hypothetical protein